MIAINPSIPGPQVSRPVLQARCQKYCVIEVGSALLLSTLFEFEKGHNKLHQQVENRGPCPITWPDRWKKARAQFGVGHQLVGVHQRSSVDGGHGHHGLFVFKVESACEPAPYGPRGAGSSSGVAEFNFLLVVCFFFRRSRTLNRW